MALRAHSPAIVHLHGHWEDPESVVLGIRSYEAILGDAHAQAMLRALRTFRTLIFIGYGSGLVDPNFGALLGWSRSVFAGSEYRHFRFATDDETEQLQRQHSPEERMFVIPYGKNHSDLRPFLNRLREPGYLAGDLPAMPLRAVPGGKSEQVARSHGRLVHTSQTAERVLEDLLPSDAYSIDPNGVDEDTGEPARVSCILNIPNARYLCAVLRLQHFTPVTALCLSNTEHFLSQLLHMLPSDLLPNIARPPTKLWPRERTQFAIAISQALSRGFILGVAFPKATLELTANRPKLTYQAIVNAVLLPLLMVHRKLGAAEFHLRIYQTGERDSTMLGPSKAAVNAVFGRRGSTEWLDSNSNGNIHLGDVARFASWTLSRHYNQHESELLQLLGAHGRL